jgi:hypothetical protein
MRMNMKKSIYVVLAVIGIVVLCDILVGAVTRSLILNVNDAGENHTNTIYAMFKREADVLILGPSTAVHNYNSKIISDSLHMKVSNAGCDGQNILYATMVLKANIERHVPRVVILDLSRVMLDGLWNDHFRSAFSYYGISKSVDDYINRLSTWQDRLKLKSNLCRYNNSLPWLLHAYAVGNRETFGGYIPMQAHDSDMEWCYIQTPQFDADELDMQYLNMLVKMCRENHIKLFVFLSPSLIVENGIFPVELQAYCKKHHIPLHSRNADTTYIHHPELFYDMSHLNATGADGFTRKVINILKDADI